MIKLLIFLLILLAGIGFGISWVTEKLPDEKTFNSGKVPDPALHGEYDGVAFITGFWKGKAFDSGKDIGFNRIRENQEVVKKYPFKISVGKSLRNADKDVLTLDYNMSDNPFWLKFVRDEIVQIGKNKYLGKMYIKLIPSMPLTVLYFHLEPAVALK